MSYNREKVIVLALEEVGYLEKASNAELDSKTGNPGSANYTKYARDIDAITDYFNGKKQGQPWCATFVNDCFVQAYGVEAAKKLLCQPMRSMAASCKYARQYFQQAGRFWDTPELGAQIFFSWGHTGIVVAYDNASVVTVEGNAVSGKQEGVWKKTYSRSNANILGYGCPDFGDGGSEDADSSTQDGAGSQISPSDGSTCTLVLPVISNGAKSEYVRSMQIQLEARGYSCGRYGTDGEYGPDTGKALREFQRDHGLDADGVCGEKTWSKLLGAAN